MNPLLKPRELVSAMRQDEDEEDAWTMYSAATSVSQANAQNYTIIWSGVVVARIRGGGTRSSTI